MSAEESDHRVLLTKLTINQEHLQQDFNRIAKAIEKSTEAQTKQSADIHKILLSVAENVGRVDRLEASDIEKGIKITNLESFVAELKPEVIRRRKIIDAITSKITLVIILAIAGIFFVNPFK